MRFAVLAAALAAVFVPLSAAQARGSEELVLFETPGCGFCKAWLRDVGPDYSNRFGAILPLRRIDLSKGVDGADRDMLPVRSVPQFVVRACNREVARFVGYNGRDKFYAQLNAVVNQIKRKRC